MPAVTECISSATLDFGGAQMRRPFALRSIPPFFVDHLGPFEGLRALADFVAAYNFGRWLKTVKGLTPFEYICKSWTSQPQRFIPNPLQQMPGLNT